MRRVLRYTLILLLVSFLSYAFVKEIARLYFLYEENQRIEGRIFELQLENKRLKKKIEALKNDQRFIEKVAREELGMIKEGEKVFKFKE
ncbi:Cell division protein FtsL [bacterium HR37]|nr:Cell division protein FtsL [bacterium HR37]